MKAAEIRRRFLEFFEERGHEVRPGGSLVPVDDPTLLFTNAGMVPFKRVFLGLEEVPYSRAVTAQKCVRAGGKHNDLEEVGRTARHHTFFEMLGNFSFGDYFKREALRFAWDFLVDELALDPDRLYVTVHHSDDEAAELWKEEVGIAEERIFRLGDTDNFWQMAETGPCGPCSELHYDVRPADERGEGRLTRDEFVALGESGGALELWNLVFMQFDRDEEGTLHPLPAPSIDTGAGLERLAAVLQGVDSNFHTDLFRPLLDRAADVLGRPYEPDTPAGTAYRVLSDHARAVAFLLADGVFPSNEGRGYVLRRILRRAVRHGWLLGRREPTLVELVEVVIEELGDVYPELRARREHVLKTTRTEEERFLSTIEGGLERFDELAPPPGGAGAGDRGAGGEDEGAGAGQRVIPGEEAFRLYDTFGFPLDLTRIMAEERGYEVDLAGFEEALREQRERSRADRRATGGGVEGGAEEGWLDLAPGQEQSFVGYEEVELETEAVGWRAGGATLGLQLRRNPFYLEAGGQISDTGEIEGEGWRMQVEEVVRVGDRVAVRGPVEGSPPGEPARPPRVRARVSSRARRNTERNHTATHLLHAALREVLGEHVVQRGSLVAPDRLRFDFTHTAPLTEDEVREVEDRVNGAIWDDRRVEVEHIGYDEAVRAGAMALFGEKYGDVVRVVRVPGVSVELCGGTHVRHTGEIGLFTILSESGVASGVRRIEAVTGPGAFRRLRQLEERLHEVASTLRASPDEAVRRAEQLLRERDELEELLRELRAEGGSGETAVVDEEVRPGGNGDAFLYRGVRLRARDAGDVRTWGDRFLETVSSGIAVVAAEYPDEKRGLFTFVTDDLVGRGLRADEVVRAVAEKVGGKGGGRPHMAQAGIERPAGIDEALREGREVVRRLSGEPPG